MVGSKPNQSDCLLWAWLQVHCIGGGFIGWAEPHPLKFTFQSRGNRTPGSRVVTGSSFQLKHMSREDHARSIELATSSKGKTRTYYSAHNFASTVSFACERQWTTVITPVWSESLWGLRKSCTGDELRRERSSNGGRRHNRSACISTTKVSFSNKIVR